MPKWELRYSYDYRFGAIMLQVLQGKEMSPLYHLPVSDLIRQIPQHELEKYLELAEKPSNPYIGIQVVREQVIANLDVRGKTVLDVGGYDGWAAKQCLDQGAARAIVLDNHQYEHYGWDEIKKDGVEYIQSDFMDLEYLYSSPDALVQLPPYLCIRNYDIPQPDVIIFFNVLYHLKNPWAGLDHLRTLLKPDGEMILCTLFRYHDGAWMYLYEPRECNKDDETVFWGPSIAALERLLKHTGWDFEQMGLQDDRVVYKCRPVAGFVPILAEGGYARS